MATDSATTLDEYLCRIPANDLDQPIDYKNMNRGSYIPKDLGRIADAMTEWESPVATALELNDADVANIREQHQQPKLRK